MKPKILMSLKSLKSLEDAIYEDDYSYYYEGETENEKDAEGS